MGYTKCHHSPTGQRGENQLGRATGQVLSCQSGPGTGPKTCVDVALPAGRCPDCGGTLRVIACIEDPPLIAKILGYVRSREAGEAAQARAPPADSQQVLKLL